MAYRPTRREAKGKRLGVHLDRPATNGRRYPSITATTLSYNDLPTGSPPARLQKELREAN